MMEENKMNDARELSLDEMDKVSGGVDDVVFYVEGLGISGDGRYEVKVSPHEVKIPDIVMGHRVDGSYFLESSIDERPRPNLDPRVRDGIGK